MERQPLARGDYGPDGDAHQRAQRLPHRGPHGATVYHSADPVFFLPQSSLRSAENRNPNHNWLSVYGVVERSPSQVALKEAERVLELIEALPVDAKL